MQSVVDVDAYGFYSLFFRNIDFDEESQLKSDCWKFGEVKDMHRKGGISHHIFVRFAAKEHAERALRFLRDKYEVTPATTKFKDASTRAPFFKDPRPFTSRKFTNYQNTFERRFSPPESRRYGNEMSGNYNVFSAKRREDDDNRRFGQDRDSKDDYKERRRVRSVSCDRVPFDEDCISSTENSFRKEPRAKDQSETKTVHFSKNLQKVFDSDTESSTFESNCCDENNIQNTDVSPDSREFHPKWTEHVADRKKKEMSHRSLQNTDVCPDSRKIHPKWTEYVADRKKQEMSHRSLDVFSERLEDEMYGKDSSEEDGSSPQDLQKQGDNVLNKDTLGSNESGAMITTMHLENIDASGSDELPLHLNKLLVSNLDYATSSEDLLQFFSPLKPVKASAPRPMLNLYDGSDASYCCVIEFAYIKSVTYIVKYIRTLHLHGRAVSFRRLSTVLEVSDNLINFNLPE